MNTELLYTIGIAAIIALVAIAIIALVTSFLRQRKTEKSRPQWEDLYPDERLPAASNERRSSNAAGTASAAPASERGVAAETTPSPAGPAPDSPYSNEEAPRRTSPSTVESVSTTDHGAPQQEPELLSTPKRTPFAQIPSAQTSSAPEPFSQASPAQAPSAQARSNQPAEVPTATRAEASPSAQVRRPFGEDDADDGGFSIDDLLASPDQHARSPGDSGLSGSDLNIDLSGLDNLPGDGAPAPSLVDATITSEQSERLDNLRQTVGDEGRSPAIRLAAFNKLLQSAEQDDQLQGILTAINANHLSLQMRALEEIERRGDDALLDEAIPLLESEHEAVALGAVKALQNIGGPIAVQALLAGLESPHNRVRSAIIDALIELKSSVVEERLLEMSNDDRESRWNIALEALASVGGAIGLEGLKSLKAITPPLDDKSPAIDEAIRQIELRVGTSGGTSEYPSFSTQGGAGSVAVSMPADDDDEFAVSLDPALFNPSKSND